MSIKYISIEREYGSGGREVAELTAEKCNIKCYGKEILEMVANEHNLPVSSLENHEESPTDSFLYSLFVMSQSKAADPDLLSQEGKLFVAESEMIKRIANEGPAIFVGRCASHVLENKDEVLRVFIRASDEYKKERISRDYGVTDKNIASLCKRINKRRADYYEFFTNNKWKDLNNYDIVLDSSRLGTKNCAEALSAIFLNK